MSDTLGNLKDELWRELGIVVLPMVRADYQLLRVLKFSKHTRRRPKVCIWSEKELSILQPPLLNPLPKIADGAPMQSVVYQGESESSVLLSLRASLEFKANAGRGEGTRCSFSFYSKKVFPDSVELYVGEHRKIGNPRTWNSLMKDSAHFESRQTCGIITEVYYAKKVLAEGYHDVEASVNATVPTPNVGTAGGSAGFENSSNARVQMEAGEYGPIAFKFMLVGWDEKNKCWVFQLNPKERPIAQGMMMTEAMWIEECPDVFCEEDE